MAQPLPQMLINELEAMVDASSLAEVLRALYEICGEKADHIRANWQDGKTAQTWERDGVKLLRLSDNLSN